MTFRTILCIGVACFMLSPIYAQQAKPPKSPKSRAKTATKQVEIKAFTLRKVDARAAVTTLSEVLPSGKVRFSADPRTNRLIASGPAEDLEVVESLLLSLEDADEQKRDTRIFGLRGDVARVEQILQMLGQHDGVKYFVDRAMNSLIASGTPDQLDELGKLVQAIDQIRAQESQLSKPLKMRIVWLSTEPLPAGAVPQKLDEQLQKAVKSLERVGIRGLQQKTQLMVNVSEPGCEFTAVGMVGERTSISVRGQRNSDGVKPARFDVSIDISGQQEDGRRQPQPAELRATVILSPSQIVVLGATPTGKSQSVFVVELIEGL